MNPRIVSPAGHATGHADDTRRARTQLLAGIWSNQHGADRVWRAVAPPREDDRGAERMTHSRTDASGGQAYQGHTERPPFGPSFGPGVPAPAAEFAERVRRNQQLLRANLKGQFDFIVCGSGSSGSGVERRLGQTPTCTGLPLEARGDNWLPKVQEAAKWS